MMLLITWGSIRGNIALDHKKEIYYDLGNPNGN